MNQNFKVVLYGFLTWVIPFVFSFLFFDRNGNLKINEALFHSIMTVFFVLILMTFFFLYIRGVEKDFIMHAGNVGLFWFLINVILDIALLIPISGMSMTEWFVDIGVVYLLILPIAYGIGTILEKRGDTGDFDKNTKDNKKKTKSKAK